MHWILLFTLVILFHPIFGFFKLNLDHLSVMPSASCFDTRPGTDNEIDLDSNDVLLSFSGVFEPMKHSPKSASPCLLSTWLAQLSQARSVEHKGVIESILYLTQSLLDACLFYSSTRLSSANLMVASQTTLLKMFLVCKQKKRIRKHSKIYSGSYHITKIYTCSHAYNTEAVVPELRCDVKCL